MTEQLVAWLVEFSFTLSFFTLTLFLLLVGLGHAGQQLDGVLGPHPHGPVQLLLQHGADVHAKDKGGLVPLHNACSYGHFEVTELLIHHGANVNAMDLWQFTPLHEAGT